MIKTKLNNITPGGQFIHGGLPYVKTQEHCTLDGMDFNAVSLVDGSLHAIGGLNEVSDPSAMPTDARPFHPREYQIAKLEEVQKAYEDKIWEHSIDRDRPEDEYDIDPQF